MYVIFSVFDASATARPGLAMKIGGVTARSNRMLTWIHAPTFVGFRPVIRFEGQGRPARSAKPRNSQPLAGP
jgi:hypothetical protein